MTYALEKYSNYSPIVYEIVSILKVAPGFYMMHDSMRGSLTIKQAHCLFFLLRNRSAERIMSILTMSKNEFYDCIENMMMIFQCSSVEQVVLKAIENGFSSYIPNIIYEQLLQQMFGFCNVSFFVNDTLQ